MLRWLYENIYSEMPDNLRRSSPKEYISLAIEGIWEVDGLGYFVFQGFGECLGISRFRGLPAALQLQEWRAGFREQGFFLD